MSKVITATNKQMFPETIAWRRTVLTAGGGILWNSLGVANLFISVVRNKSYYQRGSIKYLLPFLGANLTAARVPLIDILGVGIATNNGLTESNYSQSTGAQGNGSVYLDTLIKPSQLGISSNGGIGLGVRTVGTGVWVMASRTASQIYGLALYSQELGYWGDSSGQYQSGVTPTAKHYYWQRSSATLRQLYGNGIFIGSSTSAASVTEIATSNICVLGDGPTSKSDYQLSFAYMTDGTLTAGEIADFHTVIRQYLVIPSGKG